MANQEQLNILKEGVQAWNKWREENPDIRYPDLHDADLEDTDLTGAILNNSNLIGAFLSHANLSHANLSHAELKYADLSGTTLSHANLSHADLTYATLFDANLTYATLSSVDLSHTDLRVALVGYTSFRDVDLSVIKNLETIRHIAPSTIGIDTIYRSRGNISEVFLKEAGVPDSFLDFMRSLVAKPIDYYSCFISYSSKDEALTRRLYADLQSNHVRCWFAPEDLKIGAKIRPSIDESIRVHDKLLLILSHYSVASQWIE